MNSAPRRGARCGYCHTMLRDTDSVATCSECETPMHTECWDENGGCVQPGCAGEDAQRTGSGAGASSSEQQGRHSKFVLVTAFAILGAAALLAIVAVAVKLMGDSGAATASAVAPSPAETSSSSAEAARKAQAAAIAKDLKRAFRQIDQGHWQGSLRYLAKPQISDLSESGDPAVIFRSAYSPHDMVGNIQPNRLTVSRVQIDGREAEFQLSVPYSDRRCFKGISWAQREGGEWRYDPSTYNRSGRENLGRHGMRVRPNGC
ncbi:MAG: hypothetical protein JHD02_04260 [Thermoleophilaceae bacterium]|nr:hypothetical protein [Thermoleophilaceae bacterium]